MTERVNTRERDKQKEKNTTSNVTSNIGQILNNSVVSRENKNLSFTQVMKQMHKDEKKDNPEARTENFHRYEQVFLLRVCQANVDNAIYLVVFCGFPLVVR
jgi:hypothetical protein